MTYLLLPRINSALLRAGRWWGAETGYAMAIRNPIEWTAAVVGLNGPERDRSGTPYYGNAAEARPRVRRIEFSDLRDALRAGYEDFGQHRSDVLFLCLLYPVVGLLFARAASGNGFLPLVFPMASGFALLGPLAGLGLYEMSRRREAGLPADWRNAFGVARSRAFGSILTLSALLFIMYLLWLLVAWGIYTVTLGPQPPASVGGFVTAVFATRAGWAMIALGMLAGFVFAWAVLTITVVSFPMLLDRNVGVARAVATSVEVVRVNPRAMAAWGLVIAAGLVLGSIPFFVGLIFVLPVLGHATWHFYRRAVAP